MFAVLFLLFNFFRCWFRRYNRAPWSHFFVSRAHADRFLHSFEVGAYAFRFAEGRDDALFDLRGARARSPPPVHCVYDSPIKLGTEETRAATALGASKKPAPDVDMDTTGDDVKTEQPLSQSRKMYLAIILVLKIKNKETSSPCALWFFDGHGMSCL